MAMRLPGAIWMRVAGASGGTRRRRESRWRSRGWEDCSRSCCGWNRRKTPKRRVVRVVWVRARRGRVVAARRVAVKPRRVRLAGMGDLEEGEHLGGDGGGSGPGTALLAEEKQGAGVGGGGDDEDEAV